MSERPRLSICMIVKNEEALLARCLSSARPVADEIVVVDTGSEDETIRIAREHGARVVASDWRDDFSYSRNVSVEHATGVWILWLDGDDVVPESSLDGIASLKARPPDRVFAFVVRNQKPGGLGTEFVQARMFPNDPRIRFERRIHEQVMPSALRIGLSMEQVPVVVEHHGYADPVDLADKARRNVRLLIEEYDTTKGDPVSALEVADSYSIIEQFDDAESWYRRALAIPSCVSSFPAVAGQAWMGLGNIENRRGDHAAAAASFTRALDLTPDRPDALYGLAVAGELAGDPARAVVALERVLSVERKPLLVGVDFRQTRIKACMRLARLLQELGRFDEARAHVTRAQAEHGDRPEIHNIAGWVRFTQGRLMDALHDFERSLQVAVDGNIDAYLGLCMVYRRAGREERARDTLLKVRPLFEGFARYWAFLSLGVGGVLDVPIPASLDRGEIEKEVAYLRRTYEL